MDGDNKAGLADPMGRVRTEPAGSGKKPYRRPQILDWGSIVDLTQGTQTYGEAPSGGSSGGFTDPREY